MMVEGRDVLFIVSTVTRALATEATAEFATVVGSAHPAGGLAVAWNLRFRRSVSVLPGVKFNFNMKSQSFTFKEGPVSYTANSRGTRTRSVHLAKGLSTRKVSRRR